MNREVQACGRTGGKHQGLAGRNGRHGTPGRTPTLCQAALWAGVLGINLPSVPRCQLEGQVSLKSLPPPLRQGGSSSKQTVHQHATPALVSFWCSSHTSLLRLQGPLPHAADCSGNAQARGSCSPPARAPQLPRTGLAGGPAERRPSPLPLAAWQAGVGGRGLRFGLDVTDKSYAAGQSFAPGQQRAPASRSTAQRRSPASRLTCSAAPPLPARCSRRRGSSMDTGSSVLAS